MKRPTKDSGVPWLGDVPAAWKVSRLGFAVEKIVRKFDDTAPPLICSNKGKVVLRTEDTLGQTSDRDDGFQGVQTGDLCIHGMDTWHGAIAVSDISGKCTTVVHVCRSEQNDVRFISFYLQALAFFKVYKAFSSGVRQNTSDFRSWKAASRIPVLLPPLPEQRRIAAFLDGVVAKIDEIRGGIQREIERLGDYKKSLVAETVCRGVRGTNRAIKPSGIPWLGDVPAEWDIRKIGALYEERSRKVSEREYPALSVSKLGVIPQLEHVAKSNDVDNRKLVCKGDFAINSRSDRRGACGIAKQDGSVSLINIVLKPKASMEPAYFDWLFHSSLFADEFYKWGSGIDADVWSTRWTMMKKITIPFPPLPEQLEIAAYLDKATAQIDAAVEARKGQLEKLDILKKTTIADYTTEKKEVLA